MIEGLKTVAEAVKPVVNEVGKRAIDAFEKPIDSDKRLEAASDNKTTFRYDGLSKPQEFLAQAQGFPKEIAKDIYNSQELQALYGHRNASCAIWTERKWGATILSYSKRFIV